MRWGRSWLGGARLGGPRLASRPCAVAARRGRTRLGLRDGLIEAEEFHAQHLGARQAAPADDVVRHATPTPTPCKSHIHSHRARRIVRLDSWSHSPPDGAYRGNSRRTVQAASRFVPIWYRREWPCARDAPRYPGGRCSRSARRHASMVRLAGCVRKWPDRNRSALADRPLRRRCALHRDRVGRRRTSPAARLRRPRARPARLRAWAVHRSDCVRSCRSERLTFRPYHPSGGS